MARFIVADAFDLRQWLRCGSGTLREAQDESALSATLRIAPGDFGRDEVEQHRDL